jgi:hypothetical protein
MGGGGHQRGRPVRRPAALLCPDDVPVSERGGAPRGQPLRVHGERHLWTIPAAEGAHGVRAARVRRLRDPLRELRHQGRGAPGRAHTAEHRQLPAPAEARRAHGGLEPRALHHGPVVLQVDPVGLPAAVQAGAGLQEAGGGELVPVRQDRAGQRAGGARSLRALRDGRGAAVPGAVVLPDHGLRGAAAGQPGSAGLVREHAHGAAELDREVRRGRRSPSGCRT